MAEGDWGTAVAFVEYRAAPDTEPYLLGFVVARGGDLVVRLVREPPPLVASDPEIMHEARQLASWVRRQQPRTRADLERAASTTGMREPPRVSLTVVG
jgi:hypothetical protein